MGWVLFETAFSFYHMNHIGNLSTCFSTQSGNCVMAHWFINNLDTKLYTDKFKDENKQIKLHHIKHRNDIYTVYTGIKH